jgi:AcrR family transcriptional regulator
MSNQKPRGLRAQKKQKTRLAISQVATAMFIDRGFDNVTVAEVAHAAEVSVNTVFNYFASKEELFFDRGPDLREALCRIVRERKRGESAVAALRRAFRKLVKGDIGPELSARLKPFFATVEASPALQAHARLFAELSERQLAQTLIEAAGAREATTARVLAAMITSLQTLLARELTARVMSDASEDTIRAAVSKLGERGLELLMAAAGDFGIRADDA